MNFNGKAKRLEDVDLPRLGAEIGVGEDEIHAIIDVESSGSGFDKSGRPKMLFEPHVFYRNLPQAKRSVAMAAGLAYPNWKSGNYPLDSYPRLIAACRIDETAALKAASWGMTQILGENFAACGYKSPQEMVQKFCDDEEEHLAATIKLLKSMKIDDDLKAHNWPGVARGWNGPQYKVNNYDERLKSAYARWTKIKDTPWNPALIQKLIDDPEFMQPKALSDPQGSSPEATVEPEAQTSLTEREGVAGVLDAGYHLIQNALKVEKKGKKS
jgi:hypothetical protein